MKLRLAKDTSNNRKKQKKQSFQKWKKPEKICLQNRWKIKNELKEFKEMKEITESTNSN